MQHEVRRAAMTSGKWDARDVCLVARYRRHTYKSKGVV